MDAMDMALPDSDLRQEKGAILVEAALTMLVFLMMIFAIAEVGRFLQVQHALTNAAREGARFGIAPLSGTMPGELPKDANIRAEVNKFIESSGISSSDVSINVEIKPEYTTVTIKHKYEPLTGLFPFMKVNLVGSSSMKNETSQ